MYIVNVEGAIFNDGRWLIIKRSELEEHAPGRLSLVGGKVEQTEVGDDILEATLVREIKEEVGIEVNEIVYLESKVFMTDSNEPVVDVVFTCHYESGYESMSKDEVSEVHWMTTEEILNHTEVPDYLKETVKKAKKSVMHHA